MLFRSCPAQGKCFLLGRAVAVGITDSRGFLAFLQELQKALGAFVVFTLLKEHGVLLDFTVEILRDDIAGTRNELTVLEALRKRNEAGFSIAGLHELIGLADVVAQNGLAFNRFFQAERLQRLVGSFAVRRKLRIRNGHMLDIGRIEHGELNVELLGQGFTWLDTGTHESLVEATNFVKTIESHQHRKIACLEEIAYLNGWITREDVLKAYEPLKKNQYGQYLMDVLDGKYMDVLH